MQDFNRFFLNQIREIQVREEIEILKKKTREQKMILELELQHYNGYI